MADINDLLKQLGVTFGDEKLRETAITHRSFLNENRRKKLVHNERLEFLGDAVLELVVTEYLYKTYDEPEGVLTNWRSALVKTESLADTAAAIKLDDYIKLSRGEARGTARARKQIMANAMEALLGAIYLDQGYNVVQKFIAENIIVSLPGILKTGTWQDAKTKLQETVQEKESLTPTYDVVSEEGPDHDKVFTVGVYAGEKLIGKGSGASKQSAQQSAAQKALLKYKG